jgi:hypothetical protein
MTTAPAERCSSTVENDGGPHPERLRFANDPAELLAVDGKANQDKGDDGPPGRWMPPNTAYACQYATKFVAVLREFALPVDPASVPVLRQAATTRPN